MRKQLLIALLCPALLDATVWTVCASGCNYSDPNLAYANVLTLPGDTILWTANEAVSSCISLIWKSNEAKYITFISTRYYELPPVGIRLTPAMSALMPTIYPCNSTTPAIKAGRDRGTVTSVNVGADTITLDISTGLANGDPIACRIDNRPGMATMMGGVTASQVYTMTGVTGSTFGLLNRSTLAPIDITSAGSGTRTCIPVKVGHHVQFFGINVQTDPSTASAFNLIEFGTGEEAAYEGMPHHIEFRGLSQGRQYQHGPRNGILVNANNVAIYDSSILSAKQVGSVESHGILVLFSSQGKIRNNAISAASITLFFGGTGSAIYGAMPTDIEVTGNYIYKDGYMLTMRAAGAPSGACFPGRIYINTTPSPNTCATGACYVCGGTGLSGSWAAHTANEDPYMATSVGYLTKSLIEAKECRRCRFEGNYLANGFDGPDTGNSGALLLSQVNVDNPWGGNFDTSFLRNFIYNTVRGYIVGYSGTFDAPQSNHIIEDNVHTEMANWPENSVNVVGSQTQRMPWYGQGSTVGLKILNNTTRLGATGAASAWLFLAQYLPGPSPNPMPGFGAVGNIGPGGTFGIFADGTTTLDCTSTGLGLYLIFTSPPFPINANLFEGTTVPPYGTCLTNTTNIATVPYVSSTDSSLTPGSPYSADCVSSCVTLPPGGRDFGADIRTTNWATSGSLAGTRPWLADLSIQPGSTRATLTYTAPSDSTCNVTLWTNFPRTIEHGDTNTAGEKLDNRAGNYSVGTRRIFVFGTNVLLTASVKVWGQVACGTQIRPFDFTTQAVGTGTRSVPTCYSSSRTGEYADNPAFTSPVPLSDAIAPYCLVVPLTAGAVPTFYRETGGVVQAFLRP